MTEKPSPLFVVVNCDRMMPGHTLGVAHFAFRLLEALRRTGGVRVLCKVTPDLVDAYRELTGVCDGVVPGEVGGIEAGGIAWDASPIRPESGERVVEYSPHHFQARVTDAPAVVTCHDLHVFDIPWKYKNQAEVATRFIENMRSAHAVLTHFPRTARDVPLRAPGIEGKVFLTVSPAMLEATRPDDTVVTAASSRFGINGAAPTLLYPAQLQQHKNHRNLLGGLRLARETQASAGVPEAARVRLVCPGSEFRPFHTTALREHARSLGLDDAVAFPGFVSDDELRALYALCDGVIAPSLAEGGAYIALEAMLFRRPVAVSAIDSARLHLEMTGARTGAALDDGIEGDAGVAVFDPFDEPAIARAIAALLREGPAMVGRNEAARARVASWTFDAVATRYLSAMRWALGEGERPETVDLGEAVGVD